MKAMHMEPVSWAFGRRSLIKLGCRHFSAQLVAIGSSNAPRDLRIDTNHCQYGRLDKAGSAH